MLWSAASAALSRLPLSRLEMLLKSVPSLASQPCSLVGALLLFARDLTEGSKGASRPAAALPLTPLGFPGAMLLAVAACPPAAAFAVKHKDMQDNGGRGAA